MTIAPAHRWHVRRVKINRQGYDSSNNYWGAGAPLWFVHRDDGAYDFHIRGTKDYARCAADWAEFSGDPERARATINATGGTQPYYML